jgi:hypothetical protein
MTGVWVSFGMKAAMLEYAVLTLDRVGSMMKLVSQYIASGDQWSSW